MTIQVFNQGSEMVSSTGSAGVGVGNAPYDPMWVTTTGSMAVAPGSGVTFPVNIVATIPQASWNASAVGVTGSVNVYTSGLQGVSGTVGVNNFPGTQNVSGTVTAIIGNWPATMGVSSSATLHVWDGGTQMVSGTIGVNNFPLTQNVSGTIVMVPTATAANACTFTGTLNVNQVANIKSSAGVLYQVWVNNRSSGSIYLQLFNTTTVPALAAVPLASFTIQSGSLTGGPSTAPPVVSFGAIGIGFTTGIAIGLSSAPGTYVPVGSAGAPNVGGPNLFDIAVQFK